MIETRLTSTTPTISYGLVHGVHRPSYSNFELDHGIRRKLPLPDEGRGVVAVDAVAVAALSVGFAVVAVAAVTVARVAGGVAVVVARAEAAAGRELVPHLGRSSSRDSGGTLC